MISARPSTKTQTFRRTVALAGLSLLALISVGLGASPAVAGISSWFWSSDDKKDEKKSDAGAKSAPNGAKENAPGPARSITTDRAPQSQSTAEPKGFGTSTPSTYTGDDAAYRAFDDGKYLTALELAQEAAKKGKPAAHTLIGRIYAEGQGVAKDEKVAAQWFKRGAELGDTNAMFAMALMYAQARGGLEKNYDVAATLFEKAAMTGHPEANYNLGLLFLNGTGKPQNKHRAAKHIAYAAEKGIAAAQYDLAGLYGAGEAVPNDAYEQARWLAKSAEQGMAPAEYEYAVLLLKGNGLRKDEPKAVPFLRSAAAKGVAGAQNRLAYIYEEGIGVSKNSVEMAKWRYLAREGGVEDMIMDNKVAALPKDVQEKGRRAAQEFRDKSLVTPMSVR